MNRTESLHIKMSMDKAMYAKHIEAVKRLIPDLDTQMAKGDTLNLSYDFRIHYLDDVAECLEAVGELCAERMIVTKASCAELEEGRVLLHEVLKKLDHIIKMVGN